MKNLLNGFLLIGTEMKNKNLLVVGIVLLVVLQIGFVLGQEEGVDLTSELALENDLEVSGKGVEASGLLLRQIDITGVGLSEGESASLKIGEEEYNNIDSEKGGFFRLNEKGEIFEAKFTIKKDGEYVFGNQKIEAPAGSTITLKDGKITLEVPEDGEIKEFPSQINPEEAGYLIKITGKNVKLPNGHILDSGNLYYENGQFFIKVGEKVIIDKVKFIPLRKHNINVYFEETFDPSKHLDENYYYSYGNKMILHSTKDGGISVEILENHRILNTDEKDKLTVKLRNGDGLVFLNREKNGLVPKILHKSSKEGWMLLSNNGFNDIFFDNEKFSVKPPEELSLEKIKKEKYQSVPFEIASDSEKIDSKLRFNAYRQFSIISKENNERISFNKWRLPVSNRIEDNSLQTLEQLKEKYPLIDFRTEQYKESGVPPYLLYLTDNFLESKKGEPIFDEIFYSDAYHAAVILFERDEKEMTTLSLGRGLMDVNEPAWYKKGIRDIKNPFDVLDHEYEHLLDVIIEREEKKLIKSPRQTQPFDYLRSLDDPEIDEILFKRNSAKSVKELDDLQKQILDIYSKKYSSKMTLQEKYNEIALKAKNKLIEDKELQNSLIKIINEAKKNYDFGKGGSLSAIDEGINKGIDSRFVDQLAGHYFPFLADIQELKETSSKITELIKEKTGIPYIYAFYNSGIGGSVINSNYAELSGTYKEQSIETRKSNINSYNPAVAETYKKLTQLSFDSGKMNIKDYEYLMGPCKTRDCIDKKCIGYQLLCCKQYPGSPNC